MTASASGADDGWEVRATAPPWVESLPLPDVDGTLDGAQWGDSRWLLIDEQVLAGVGDKEVFHHHATQVITTTGVDDASEILIEFDPSYQRLTIHDISIHRDGTRIDALDPGALKVIHREPDLERRIFNGSVEILALLPDIRVGDVVEWSWTLRGHQPGDGGPLRRRLGAWMERSHRSPQHSRPMARRDTPSIPAPQHCSTARGDHGGRWNGISLGADPFPDGLV